tara:strand:+ start:4120 stop:6069 length:1950 start_codon:yes stop_codon:yes gene_type:complete
MKRLTLYLILILIPSLHAFGMEQSSDTLSLESDLANNSVSGDSSFLFSNGILSDLSNDEILPPDQAFKIDAEIIENNKLRLKWEIAKGTYLYQDKVKIDELSDNFNFKTYALPSPKIKKNSVRPDGTMGDVAVYETRLVVDIPFQHDKNSNNQIKILASYQGCAEQGVCYPPQKSELSLFVLSAINNNDGKNVKISTPLSQAEIFNEQDSLLEDLETADFSFGIFLSLGFGLLVAFTACMYPMIPILSSLIMGQGKKLTTIHSFNLSLAYTQGVAITFGAIGGAMALFGQSINIQSALQTPLVLIPTVILFVILAMSMFGFYEIQIPASIQSLLNRYSNKQRGGSLFGVFLMGVLSALIVGPCGGPILLAVLAFAAQSQDLFTGFIYLWVFGFGMGLPLLVLGAGGGALLPKSGIWMDKVKVTGGILMLALAIVFLERLSPTYVPEIAIMVFWGILLIVSGIYYGALKKLSDNQNGWEIISKSFGVILLIYGSLFLVGVAAGGKDTWNPLNGIVSQNSSTSNSIKDSFVKIYSIEELNMELAAAKAKGKPVLLDFYADWCTYCKTMEKEIFPNLKVIAALKNFSLIQADITRQDQENIRLSKYLNMPAPPAIYFWDKDGNNMLNLRILGETSVDQLVARANAAYSSNKN